MLTDLTKKELFEIVFALEKIWLSDLFLLPKKLSAIYNNYSFIINAIIYNSNTIDHLNIDFLDGVQPFKISSPTNENVKRQIDKITVGYISDFELSLFPLAFLSSETKNIKEQYESYKHENDLTISNFFLDLYSIFSKRTLKHIKHDNSVFELDPSLYYILNETIAESFLGGGFQLYAIERWESFQYFDINEGLNEGLKGFPNALEFSLLNKKSENIRLLLDAQLNFSDQIIREPLFYISPPWESLLEQRIFKCNVYCPIDKNEIIRNLSLSSTVKNNLSKMFQFIDTLPTLERKKTTVQQIIEEFRRKGLTEYLEPIQQLHALLEEKSKRDDAAHSQLLKRFERNMTFPDFFDRLKPEHKNRYRDIVLQINDLPIPIFHDNLDDIGRYKNIFIALATLTGEIFSSALNYKNVTIPTVRIYIDEKRCGNDLTKTLKDKLAKYSEKWKRKFNQIKHPDNMRNITLTYYELLDFFQNTNEIVKQLLPR
jgi:hypothetical protein